MALYTGRPVARSHTTVVSRWFVMPSARRSAACNCAFESASCTTETTLRQISSASCSTQPGRGKIWRCSFCPTDTTRPSASKIRHRDEAVPWSTAAMKSAGTRRDHIQPPQSCRVVAMSAARRRIQTEVLVIGGGATGVGTAWDAALRGFDVVLVERSDLVEGTSGRFHGLLHSGGRYVVKDPLAAKECVDENALLRRLMPDCIEDTGGLFVETPDDDPAYAERFLDGCRGASLPVEELEVAEALRREPRLNPRIRRAFAVPDASIAAWKTAWSLARGATAHGARVLTYHRVVDLHRADGAITGARVRDERTGDELDIEASFILNASGAWAAQILHMAGIEDVGVIPGKGIMIAMNHRLVNTVINRCVMPADGDILVPIRTVSVIGTTDIRAADPDEIPVTQAEVDQMLDDGERLVPGFRHARALRVWAGVRPLFQDARAGEGKDPRDVSRTHAVVDHQARDGVQGLLTMSGGKLTTLRLMAQDLVDAMCTQLGEQRPCRTEEVKPPGNEDGDYYEIGSRLRRRERTMAD